MCKAKGFITGATLLALILIPCSIGLACGAKPAQTPTPPPPVTEPATSPSTTPQLSEETPPPTSPELDIPAGYKTYTDEENIFSISYPSDWKAALSQMADMERKGKEAISKLISGASVEQFSLLFFGGRQTAEGYEPNVGVGIGPVPESTWTIDQVVDWDMQGTKQSFPDYKEFSRVKVTIDGRPAIIVDWQGTLRNTSTKARYLQMDTLVGETLWGVTCTSLPEDFDQWENDFNTIVKSLRIYK